MPRSIAPAGADLARALRFPAACAATTREDMHRLRWLFSTDSGMAGLLLRLTLAVVMFPHGAQKALGWFGGQGFASTIAFFARSGIPPVLALLVIATEFLGSLGLALGLLTRVVAFGLLYEMLVAIVTVHWPNGFFMNWTGTQQGEGFE